jgi:hypothetical protein
MKLFFSSRDEVSMMEYYAYYFYYRQHEPNPYTCCGRLSQQIIVNAYSCVEAGRLAYHFLNQKTLRSETYQGITDAMGEDSSTGKNLGVEYILHSSFTGGPRYMVQNYHDGMAISRVHGAPDLFITFTCNPKWQEITDALSLEPGQSPSDRPDIVTRVFHMKYNEFLADVNNGNLFGPIKACEAFFVLLYLLPFSPMYLSTVLWASLMSMGLTVFFGFLYIISILFVCTGVISFTDLYVVEFQKRGLPHTHTLIWLKKIPRNLLPR